jgi:hypothetical protein
MDPQRATEQAGRGQPGAHLYADSEGRIRIAEAFNAAIKAGATSARRSCSGATTTM